MINQQGENDNDPFQPEIASSIIYRRSKNNQDQQNPSEKAKI